MRSKRVGRPRQSGGRGSLGGARFGLELLKREVRDSLRDPVLQHREVRRREIGDRLALLVDDAHVDGNQDGPAAELWLRADWRYGHPVGIQWTL